MIAKKTDKLTLYFTFYALMLSIGIYGFVLVYLDKLGDFFDPTKTTMLTAFVLIAVVEVVISLMFNAKSKLAQNFEDYYSKKIICWALNESVAIYGFVLSFITGSIAYYVLFAPVAIFLDIYMKPDNNLIEKFNSN